MESMEKAEEDIGKEVVGATFRMSTDDQEDYNSFLETVLLGCDTPAQPEAKSVVDIEGIAGIEGGGVEGKGLEDRMNEDESCDLTVLPSGDRKFENNGLSHPLVYQVTFNKYCCH